ncbi:MAG: DUF4038 domain-containing protein [Gemmatimonadota bacterium]
MSRPQPALPLRVSGDGRHFVDRDGEPFFWLGDTQWELLRCFPLDDARQLLARRREQGFSAVLAMVTGCCERDVPDVAGQLPFVDGDPDRPNEAYFQRADAIVAAAGELGLVLVLGVFHKRHRAVFPPEKVRRFARFCASRWADHPHVVWSAYPEAEPAYVPLVRELAAGLREGDGGTHLITLHPDPSPCTSSFVHGETWLDFNSVQTWLFYHLVTPMTAADYERTPAKPVVMAEGGYEGHQCGAVHAPHLVRKQAWWTGLAGGHHCYGHNDNYVAPEAWRSWIDAPGARQMGVFRRILEVLPEWWRIVPEPSILIDGAGDGLARHAAGRGASGQWALVYLSEPDTVRLRLEGVLAGPRCRATWVNPVTGNRTGFSTFAAAGTLTTSTPGGWEDTLVLIEPA